MTFAVSFLPVEGALPGLIDVRPATEGLGVAGAGAAGFTGAAEGAGATLTGGLGTAADKVGAAGAGGLGATVEDGGGITPTGAGGIGGFGAPEAGAADADGIVGAPVGAGIGGFGVGAIPGGFGGMAAPGAGGIEGLGGVGIVGGAPAAAGMGFGGRLIMAASRGLAAPGLPSRFGGRTMRTVSFLGSFMAEKSIFGWLLAVGAFVMHLNGKQRMLRPREGVNALKGHARFYCRVTYCANER